MNRAFPPSDPFNEMYFQSVFVVILEATAGLVSCLREKSVQAIHNASATVRDWTPVTDGDFVLPYGDSQTFTGSVMTGETNKILFVRKLSITDLLAVWLTYGDWRIFIRGFSC